MTVVVKASDKTFRASAFMFANPVLVNAIVEAALISQTEAFIDMMLDGQEDMSREAIQNTLRGVKGSAGDFISDMLGELEIMLKERMTAVNYGAAVTGLKYDLAGDVTDIEVNVSVGVE
jgi:hypothetical protein